MKVYAAGAYGFGNFGDDFYVDAIAKRMPQMDWTFRGDASEYRPFHYDLTLVAGGGLLYDKTGPCGTSSLKHHFRYPAVAQWFDKSTGMIGAGVQGALTPEAMAPYVPVLRSMDLCAVRDRPSARFLRGIGVESVVEGADLVYVTPATPVREAATCRRPVLGVVASQPGSGLAHSNYAGFETRVTEALAELERDFELRFFAFDKRHDAWLAESWANPVASVSYDRNAPNGLQDFTRAFREVDVFLTTRFHGVVLSALNSTPFVAIGAPGEKTERECHSMDYPFCLSYTESARGITQAVQSAWSSRSDLEHLLGREVGRKQRSANRNFLLLRMFQVAPESLVSRAWSPIVEDVRRSGPRTLVVWNGDEALWEETEPRLASLGRFDCLLPAGRHIHGEAIETRIEVPSPGLMAWNALGAGIRKRLADGYDNTIVCHAGQERPASENLIDIAGRTAPRVWDLALWHHTVRIVSPDEIASARSANREERGDADEIASVRSPNREERGDAGETVAAR